jgi:hypothetical protein
MMASGPVHRPWSLPVGVLGLDDAVRICGVDGRVFGCVVLHLTLFIRKGDRPDVRTGIVRAYEAYRKAAGSVFQWGIHPQTGKVEPLAQSNLGEMSQWPGTWLRLYDFQAVFGGSDAQDGSVDPYRFSAVAREEEPGELSFVHATLPVRWADAHPIGEFAQLVQAFCNALGPSHGYAGLAIVGHPDGPPDVRPLFDVARRFEGLDLESPIMCALCLATADRIKCVNWLTVLGREWIDRLGGERALLPKLTSEVTVHRFTGGDGGLVLQAGPRPRFGDRTSGEPMSAYHAVGSAVAPVVVRNPRLLSAPGGFDFAEGTKWLSRFG